jgi:hypothetical protein
MSTVNAINPKVDLTVRVFDEFYEFAVDVPTSEYDVVYSFFLSVFKDALAARNFATSLFLVSQQSGTPVLTLLQEMQGQDDIRVTSTLSYYLNGIRSPSTLLGINTAVTPNVWAARNVKP